MRGIKVILFVFWVSVCTGCDTTKPSDHHPEAVIEAYIVADESLPEIRVSWTQDIDYVFDFEQLAVSDAAVKVVIKADGAEAEETFRYVSDPGRSGVYLPAEEHVVVPGRRYALEVLIPGEDKAVRAETRIPGRFEIVRVSADTLSYLAEKQYSVSITRSSYPDRQSIYMQSVEALNPSVRTLTPFYLETIYQIKDPTEEDYAMLDLSELDSYILGSSPPINEENYEINSDGTLVIPLPWFGVAFYGDSRVSTTAIDDALFDFIRFQTVQQGGSTLSPGEIPDVLDHVENGRGVFGGMARVARVVHILREK